MTKDYKIYCNDILECIGLIRQYVKDIDFENFTQNVAVQDQVIRRLEIIGEAAKRLPDMLKAEISNIPWKDIAGTRDWLVHAYDKVDIETIWGIIKNDLDPLEKEIKLILGKQN